MGPYYYVPCRVVERLREYSEALSTGMPNRSDAHVLGVTVIQLALFLPPSSQEEEDLALAQALSASEAEYRRQQV